MNRSKDGGTQAGETNGSRPSGILGVELSAEDVAASDWLSAVAALEDGPGRWRVLNELRQRSEALTADRPQEAAILRLLCAVGSLRLSVGTSSPLTAGLKRSYGSTPSVFDLDDSDANALASMAVQVPAPWLRARLADAALLAGHGAGKPSWSVGGIAARAYLEYAQGTDGGIVSRRESLQRAMALGWIYLKSDKAFTEALWAGAMGLMQQGLDDGLPGISVPIAEEIRRRAPRLAAQAAEAFEADAEARLADEVTPLVVDLMKEAAALWRTAGNDARELAAQHRTSDALVALARGPGQAMLQAEWMMEGIAVLRRHRGDRAHIRELQGELATIRSRIGAEMSEISHEIDVSDVVAWVQKRVNAEHLPAALMQLAFAFSSWPQATQVRDSVIDHASRFVFTGMFRQVTFDAQGVPVDVTAPFDPSDAEDMERRMVQHVAQFDHPILAQVAIPAALDVLQERFEPTLADMRMLLHQSPASAPGHDWTMARGLLAGFERQWEEVAVFLIPQAEPFVRAAFRRAGIHTLSLSSTTEGAEEEKSLTELLNHPDVGLIMSQDLVLQLKALLTHKAGHNLRNRYGHGLIRDDELACVGTVVLWWTMLRLVLWPFRTPASAGSSDVESAGCAQHDPPSAP